MQRRTHLDSASCPSRRWTRSLSPAFSSRSKAISGASTPGMEMWSSPGSPWTSDVFPEGLSVCIGCD